MAVLLERNGRYVDVPTINRSTDTWGLTVRNAEFDEIETYEIISGKREIELDGKNDKIKTSEDSPIGKALNGKKVGSIVRVRLPKSGVSEYEILEIK